MFHISKIETLFLNVMQQPENFKEYIISFEKKLELIAIDDVTSVMQCKRYLTHLLQHTTYYLVIYADVLNKLIKHSSKNKESILLVDYGSGNGLLGIFAKFCGFKKVFINDIDTNFVNASLQLANQLNINMDGYITGNISAVQAYFKNESPDAIVGTDVIEHIYDLEHFFSSLQQINPFMVSVFTTASNPENYFKVCMLKKIQLKDEFKGGSPDDHILFGQDKLEPYLMIREQIIRKHTNSLPETSIINLAKATRGKNEQDIIAVIERYKITGKLPVPPANDTNTCNPITGSWSERILSLNEYSLLCRSNGFTPIFYNGFYNEFESDLKKYIKKVLNIAISILGNKISPYIIIVSYRKKI